MKCVRTNLVSFHAPTTAALVVSSIYGSFIGGMKLSLLLNTFVLALFWGVCKSLKINLPVPILAYATVGLILSCISANVHSIFILCMIGWIHTLYGNSMTVNSTVAINNDQVFDSSTGCEEGLLKEHSENKTLPFCF